MTFAEATIRACQHLGGENTGRAPRFCNFGIFWIARVEIGVAQLIHSCERGGITHVIPWYAWRVASPWFERMLTIESCPHLRVKVEKTPWRRKRLRTWLLVQPPQDRLQRSFKVGETTIDLIATNDAIRRRSVDALNALHPIQRRIAVAEINRFAKEGSIPGALAGIR